MVRLRRGHAIAGTSHDRHDGGADALALDRLQVDAFLRAVVEAFPRLPLDLGDVRLVHRGLLPASPRGDGVRLETTSAIVDHRVDGIHGLISILGVRYTTARDTAERAVDLAVEQLARPVRRCRTAVAPLVGGDMDDFDDFLREATTAENDAVPVRTRERLARTYGTRHRM